MSGDYNNYRILSVILRYWYLYILLLCSLYSILVQYSIDTLLIEICWFETMSIAVRVVVVVPVLVESKVYTTVLL